MSRHASLAARFFENDRGQDLIEYALLASFVGILAIIGAGLLGTSLNNWYGTTAGNVDGSAASAS